MSKTPRTDVEVRFRSGQEVVLVGFARQLETELAEARARIVILEGCINDLRRGTGGDLRRGAEYNRACGCKRQADRADVAERVYGGFDMMRLHRENEQLKRQNAMLCHELNELYENCMSIEDVQQMMLDFANSRVAHTNYSSDIDHRNDVFKFFEEWRQDNDC